MKLIAATLLALATAPAFASPPADLPKQASTPLLAPPAKADPFDLRTAPQLDDIDIENRRRDMFGREHYRAPPSDEYRFQFCMLDKAVHAEQCETLARRQPRLFLLGPDAPRFNQKEAAPATSVQRFVDSLAAPLPPPCEPAPTANAPAAKPAGPTPCPAPR